MSHWVRVPRNDVALLAVVLAFGVILYRLVCGNVCLVNFVEMLSMGAAVGPLNRDNIR